MWIVPCGARPDKPSISHPQKRLQLVQKAVEDFFPPDFPVKVDTIEIDNGDSIPTFYLMQQYEKLYPEYEFWFVMGTDLIPTLHQWDEGQRLI